MKPDEPPTRHERKKADKKPPHVIVTGDWLRVVLSPRGWWTQHQLQLLSDALNAPSLVRLSWFVGREISVELAARIEDLPYEARGAAIAEKESHGSE